MKGWRLLITLVFISSIGLFQSRIADSPVTSTNFYQFYPDVEIVKNAKESKELNNEIIQFLLDPEQKIELKLATINALSWKYKGSQRAVAFKNALKTKYNVISTSLGSDVITADDILCFGYLKLLDNIFKPELAIPILIKAVNKNKTSYAAHIILMIAQTQVFMKGNNWCKIAKLTDKIKNNQNLIFNLRSEARLLIIRYLDSFKKYC